MDTRIVNPVAIVSLSGLVFAGCHDDPDRYCDGNRVLWAADGSLVEQCGTGQVCRSSERMGAECGFDAAACKADGEDVCLGGRLLLCRAPGFGIVLDACEAHGMTCLSGDSAFCGYPDLPCSTTSARICAKGGLATCGSGGFVVQVQPCYEEGQTCVEGPTGGECVFADRTCTPGVDSCFGDGIALCGESGHVYHVNPCPQQCVGDATGAECADASLPCTTPGRQFCLDDRSPATCGKHGFVTELRSCHAGESCVTDGSVAECGLPDRPCTGRDRYVCTDEHSVGFCGEAGFLSYPPQACGPGESCVANEKGAACLLASQPCSRWSFCAGGKQALCDLDLGFAFWMSDCKPDQTCFDDGKCGGCALPSAEPCQESYCDGLVRVGCNECHRVSSRVPCKLSCTDSDEYGPQCDLM
jgi:hypothetical protein